MTAAIRWIRIRTLMLLILLLALLLGNAVLLLRVQRLENEMLLRQRIEARERALRKR